MATLSNRPAPTASATRLSDRNESFGPFVAVGDDHFRFDTRLRGYPIWLGHVATPMCGVLQHRECWTGQWSTEMLRIKQSYTNLIARIRGRFCGDLRLTSVSEISHPAELVYQYIAVSVIDQYSETHESIAASIESQCRSIFNEHSELLAISFADGVNFEFGFELRQQIDGDRFANALTLAGIENQRVEPDQLLPGRFPSRDDGNNRWGIFVKHGLSKLLAAFLAAATPCI